MGIAAGEMVERPPDIDPETVDLKTHTEGETGKAPQVVDFHFFLPEMGVTETQPEVLLLPKKEFPAEYEMPQEVVNKGASSGTGLLPE